MTTVQNPTGTRRTRDDLRDDLLITTFRNDVEASGPCGAADRAFADDGGGTTVPDAEQIARTISEVDRMHAVLTAQLALARELAGSLPDDGAPVVPEQCTTTSRRRTGVADGDLQAVLLASLAQLESVREAITGVRR
jgi:hypothetical protein